MGINDLIAIPTLDFLRRHNITVPGRSPVCGFDDTLDALGQRLTSYNFNVPAVVRGMVDFVLRPGVEMGRHDREFPVEIEGVVIERGSSGVAGGNKKVCDS